MTSFTGYPFSTDSTAVADVFAGMFRPATYYLPQILAIVKGMPPLLQGVRLPDSNLSVLGLGVYSARAEAGIRRYRPAGIERNAPGSVAWPRDGWRGA